METRVRLRTFWPSPDPALNSGSLVEPCGYDLYLWIKYKPEDFLPRLCFLALNPFKLKLFMSSIRYERLLCLLPIYKVINFLQGLLAPCQPLRRCVGSRAAQICIYSERFLQTRRGDLIDDITVGHGPCGLGVWILEIARDHHLTL